MTTTAIASTRVSNTHSVTHSFARLPYLFRSNVGRSLGRMPAGYWVLRLLLWTGDRELGMCVSFSSLIFSSCARFPSTTIMQPLTSPSSHPSLAQSSFPTFSLLEDLSNGFSLPTSRTGKKVRRVYLRTPATD